MVVPPVKLLPVKLLPTDRFGFKKNMTSKMIRNQETFSNKKKNVLLQYSHSKNFKKKHINVSHTCILLHTSTMHIVLSYAY